MNLKKFAIGAAIAASMVGGSAVATAPATAATLTSGSFDITSQTTATNAAGSTFKLNFTNPIVSVADGGFTGLTGTSIASLILNKVGTTTIGPINNFISGLHLGADAVTFNLTGGDLFANFTSTTKYTVGGTLFGTLVSGNTILGDGSIQVTRNGGVNRSTTSIVGVPTPALLPALLGMGAAAIRKRKGEAAEAESETEAVEVNA